VRSNLRRCGGCCLDSILIYYSGWHIDAEDQVHIGLEPRRAKRQLKMLQKPFAA
jgi:hypothetical protein